MYDLVNMLLARERASVNIEQWFEFSEFTECSAVNNIEDSINSLIVSLLLAMKSIYVDGINENAFMCAW